MSRLHPFLFALFLAAGAFDEVRPLGDPKEALLLVPALLLAVLALTALLTLGFRKNRDKGPLLATLVLFLAGLGGELATLAGKALPASQALAIGSLPWSLVLVAIPILLALLGILLARRDLGPLNRAVTAATAALLVMTLARPLVDPREQALRDLVEPHAVTLTLPKAPPDIYYIVCDSYTSFDFLQALWNHDASPFRAFLEEKGFVVDPAARSEYKYTLFSLASRLSMRYPPDTMTDWDRRYDRNAMIRVIEHSPVAAMLEGAGYTIVNCSMIGLGSSRARYPITPQVCFRSVTKMLLGRSVYAFRPAKARRDPTQRTVRKKLQPFEDLKGVIADKGRGPRFIYAHLMIAHHPFVFNRDGTTHKHRLAAAMTNADYLEQALYATGLIQDLVERILAESERPPVIILQADHGCRNFKGNPAMAERESYGILNAALLPGLRQEEWREHPPVNTFRIVFNHLFNAGFPYLTNTVVRRSGQPEPEGE